MHGRKVLIIEDDLDLQNLLVRAFSREGAEVFAAADGQGGLRRFYDLQPDLVILDLLMPILDGWKTFARIRSFSDVPIIVLSVLGEDDDIVRGLDAGAADYLAKPFSVPVLLARARATLRDKPPFPVPESVTAYGDGYLTIDLERRRVSVRDQQVHLSDIEYRLLSYLFQNAGRALGYQEILDHVWGLRCANDSKYVHIYLWRLRQKLEEDPQNPEYLVTERGRGYRFQKRGRPQAR